MKKKFLFVLGKHDDDGHNQRQQRNKKRTEADHERQSGQQITTFILRQSTISVLSADRSRNSICRCGFCYFFYKNFLFCFFPSKVNSTGFVSMIDSRCTVFPHSR